MQIHRLVVGPLQENCYLVVSEGTGDCVVIDPGGEAGKIIREIQVQQLKVGLIVNTHGHPDHTGGVATVQQATGATYAIHAMDMETILNGNSHARSWLPDFIEPPTPDRFLLDEEDLAVGEVKLRVLATPGHTPGAVCFSGDGVVFTGDTLFEGTIGRYDLPGGNGPVLLESIRTRLLTLPGDTQVLPGHGSVSTIGRERENNPFLQPGSEWLLLR